MPKSSSHSPETREGAQPVQRPADDKVARDRRMLQEAKQRGPLATLGAFLRLSGPGWLQAAITLGGGSLGASLFLGALVGFSVMWIQPLAMLMGIIMLSAIGYVVLSTGERPFQAIHEHVNPVLAWSWLVGTSMANMVWCMPQFRLGIAALHENLGVPEGSVGGGEAAWLQWPHITTVGLALVAGTIVWFYNAGSKGIKIFEVIVKLMVALIVFSFLGVVVTMTIRGDLNWLRIFAGFIPDPNLLTQPAATLRETIAHTGDAAVFWTDHVVSGQRDRMIAVAATAVGINMTFLLPYSMLARGWDKEFRGMAIFDLATALFIPFLIVTTCIVVAAGAQMHNQPAPGLLGEVDEATGEVIPAEPDVEGRFQRMLENRVLWEMREHDRDLYNQLRMEQEMYEAQVASMQAHMTEEAFASALAENPALEQGPLDVVVAERVTELPDADRFVGAVVIDRDAWDLARALEPLTGPFVAQFVFGIGVLGVALSTIIILMLINGFVFAEMFNVPGNRVLHRLGALVVVIVGAAGSLTLWQEEARYYLVVPTSVFGMMLAPIAYLTFFCLMNNRNLLGSYMPTGLRRVWWNLLMLAALVFAVSAASWAIWSQDDKLPGTNIEGRVLALGIIVFLLIWAMLVHYARRVKAGMAG